MILCIISSLCIMWHVFSTTARSELRSFAYELSTSVAGSGRLKVMMPDGRSIFAYSCFDDTISLRRISVFAGSSFRSWPRRAEVIDE